MLVAKIAREIDAVEISELHHDDLHSLLNNIGFEILSKRLLYGRNAKSQRIEITLTSSPWRWFGSGYIEVNDACLSADFYYEDIGWDLSQFRPIEELICDSKLNKAARLLKEVAAMEHTQGGLHSTSSNGYVASINQDIDPGGKDRRVVMTVEYNSDDD